MKPPSHSFLPFSSPLSLSLSLLSLSPFQSYVKLSGLSVVAAEASEEGSRGLVYGRRTKGRSHFQSFVAGWFGRSGGEEGGGGPASSPSLVFGGIGRRKGARGRKFRLPPLARKKKRRRRKKLVCLLYTTRGEGRILPPPLFLLLSTRKTELVSASDDSAGTAGGEKSFFVGGFDALLAFCRRQAEVSSDILEWKGRQPSGKKWGRGELHRRANLHSIRLWEKEEKRGHHVVLPSCNAFAPSTATGILLPPEKEAYSSIQVTSPPPLSPCHKRTHRPGHISSLLILGLFPECVRRRRRAGPLFKKIYCRHYPPLERRRKKRDFSFFRDPSTQCPTTTSVTVGRTPAPTPYPSFSSALASASCVASVAHRHHHHHQEWVGEEKKKTQLRSTPHCPTPPPPPQPKRLSRAKAAFLLPLSSPRFASPAASPPSPPTGHKSGNIVFLPSQSTPSPPSSRFYFPPQLFSPLI